MTKRLKSDLFAVIAGLFCLALMIVVFVYPELILHRDCFTVRTIIGCAGDRCRVILNNGLEGITFAPPVVGDKVCEDIRYKNVYRIMLNEKK
jgi:hypothetical protein